MKTAMILAAGRGERLRPLTDCTPKPLFSLGNQTLLDHHLSHLSQAGFQRVIINHAYLGWKIKHYIKKTNAHNLENYFFPRTTRRLRNRRRHCQCLAYIGE